MPRTRDEERGPLRPDRVKEGAFSEDEAPRERNLTREEFVTAEYAPGEAVDRLPGKRELGDADGERGAMVAELASVPGVGPSTAADLVRIGVESVRDLAQTNPGRIADDLFVDPQVARKWVAAAREHDAPPRD